MVIVDLSEYDCQISCCDHARRLILEGTDPEELVLFVRGETPVFAKASPLSWWSARRVQESTKGEWPKHVLLPT